MKNTLLAIFVALLIVPMSAFAAFDTNLKYGSKGETVKELQEFLTDQGFYSGGVTGNFYSLTLAGVKKFQTSHNLPATGYFGPMSRGVANQILASAIQDTETAEIVETGATTTPVVVPDDLTKKVADLTVKIEEQKAVLGSIVQNTTPMAPPPPVVPVVIPQTVSVSYVYRTDAPYVAPGNTQDSCPTFTFTSDRPFSLDKIVLQTNATFATVGYMNTAGDMVKTSSGLSFSRTDKLEKTKTIRICGPNNTPQTTATLIGSETVVVGNDGNQITVPDVTFSF